MSVAMSTRTVYSIVKGVDPDRARTVIEDAAKSLPGPQRKNSKWSDWTYVVESKQMVALACPDALVLADEAWRLAAEIARVLDAPHLELRVQEGDHWDFTLYHRAQVVADFSTRVSYFNSSAPAPRPWKLGNAAAFAELWILPLQRVLPYLVDWDQSADSRFAVEGDSFPTGDWRQIFDFMRAIGIDNPLDHPDHYEFEVPK